jgi:hypothetical protein
MNTRVLIAIPSRATAAALLAGALSVCAQDAVPPDGLAPLAVQAPLGTSFTYQGKLNVNGSPASGSFDLQFTLHDSLAGGQLVAGPVAKPSVAVAGGLFTVTLDFGQSPFDGSAVWLEISVRPPGGVYTLLTPRQPLTAVPYALRALNGASGIGGAGTANTIPVWTGATTLGDSLITQSGVSVFMPAFVSLAATGIYSTSIAFGTPNGDRGMTIAGTARRADFRLSGDALTIAVGLPGAPPAAANGIVIDATGRVSMGGVANAKLHVVSADDWPAISGKSTTGFAGYFDGPVSMQGSLIVHGTFSNPSDALLKTDVAPLSYGLDELRALAPVSWRWAERPTDSARFGVVAQDLEKVLPDLVVRECNPDAPLGVDYLGLIPVLINALQEEDALLRAKSGEVDALTTRLRLLEERLLELERSAPERRP